MIINFSPIRMDRTLTAAVKGGTLILNGTEVDLEAPAHDWVLGAEQVDGDWHVTLLLPHGPDADAAALFPEPVTVTGDGPVPLPGAKPAPKA